MLGQRVSSSFGIGNSYMADADFPFVASVKVEDDATAAVLKWHAGREDMHGKTWRCHLSAGKGEFRFVSREERERFVTLIWCLEHLKAEVSE
jgi:hypothetical protein